MRIPVAKESYPLLCVTIMVGLSLSFFSDRAITIMFFILAFLIYFFRDLNRTCPNGDPKIIVAPADGKVIKINPELKTVSIFMSLLDAHINYAPVEGKVEGLEYKKGQFLRADSPLASEKNETNSIEIGTDYGKVGMSQVAGLVARRIVCYLKIGDQMKAGDKIGLIKFGSRVDLTLPENSQIWVKLGQRVKGRQSIIGRFS